MADTQSLTDLLTEMLFEVIEQKAKNETRTACTDTGHGATELPTDDTVYGGTYQNHDIRKIYPRTGLTKV